MLDMTIETDQPAAQFYADLTSSAAALVGDEPDAIANMANVAALIWQYVPDLNWAGFYRIIDGELVLGPFQGKTACIRIAMGAGVCGTAAATGKTQRVADVHAFPGHIACDADSRLPDRFGPEDEAGLAKLIGTIANRLG